MKFRRLRTPGHRIARVLSMLIVGVAAGSFTCALAAESLVEERTLVIPDIKPPTAGSFSLVDHTGRRVTEAEFRDRFLLVYFGYTFCPDICPTGLQEMSTALDLLGPMGQRVQPLFVTIDPERDTVDVLTGYVEAFHPRLVGLTGSPEEIKTVSKAYGVRYFKLFYPWSGEEKDENGREIPEYAVHHTSFTYLMGPDGRGLFVFPYGTPPEDMARKIRQLVAGS